MRKSLGTKSILYPQPVLLIATYDENFNPDIMNAAWGGVADYDKIYLCLDKTHKTTQNILLHKCFTVSMATKETVISSDYVGLVSAFKEKDKVKKSGFTVTKSELINAPLINELPLTLECELISFDMETEWLFAKVINVSVEENILKEDNKIDLSKFFPLVYDQSNHEYLILGESIGKAFHDGLKLK